jgi:predicted anti-sigma-YlaC factor YlaD
MIKRTRHQVSVAFEPERNRAILRVRESAFSQVELAMPVLAVREGMAVELQIGGKFAVGLGKLAEEMRAALGTVGHVFLGEVGGERIWLVRVKKG